MSDPVQTTVVERVLDSISSIVSTIAFLGMIWIAVHVASSATGAKDVYRYVISHFSNFVDPQIEVAVEHGSDGRLVYEYTVGNGLMGFQQIRHFTIATNGGTVYGPSGVWRPFRVATLSSHYGLSWIFSPDDRSLDGISRGEAKSGFLLRSHLLPTVVRAHAGNKLDYLPHVGLLTDMTTPAGKRVTRWTVGPMNRKSPRDLNAVYSRVKADILRSVELGWIDEASTADWLATKLEWSRMEFRSGEPTGAVGPLHEILIFLNDHDRHGISNEAFAIVYHNVSWLRDRMGKARSTSGQHEQTRR